MTYEQLLAKIEKCRENRCPGGMEENSGNYITSDVLVKLIIYVKKRVTGNSPYDSFVINDFIPILLMRCQKRNRCMIS